MLFCSFTELFKIYLLVTFNYIGLKQVFERKSWDIFPREIKKDNFMWDEIYSMWS